MKKIFIISVFAFLGFVACNSFSESKATKNTFVVTVDTLVLAPLDTLHKVSVTFTNSGSTLKK